MSEPEYLYVIGSLLLSYCAVVCTASVWVHARVDWRATPLGKHLMYYMAAMAATLDLGVIRFLFGDSGWFQILRTAVFVAVPVMMTQRLVIQLRAQREWRKPPHVETPGDVPETPPDRGEA